MSYFGTHIYMYLLARQILQFYFIFGILMEHGPASVGSLRRGVRSDAMMLRLDDNKMNTKSQIQKPSLRANIS